MVVDFYHTKDCNSHRGRQYPCDCSKPRKTVKDKIAETTALMEIESVKEAARALCRARCASFDRDPGCQDQGRCGTNWQIYTWAVVNAITGPALK